MLSGAFFIAETGRGWKRRGVFLYEKRALW